MPTHQTPIRPLHPAPHSTSSLPSASPATLIILSIALLVSSGVLLKTFNPKFKFSTVFPSKPVIKKQKQLVVESIILAQGAIAAEQSTSVEEKSSMGPRATSKGKNAGEQSRRPSSTSFPAVPPSPHNNSSISPILKSSDFTPAGDPIIPNSTSRPEPTASGSKSPTTLASRTISSSATLKEVPSTAPPFAGKAPTDTAGKKGKSKKGKGVASSPSPGPPLTGRSPAGANSASPSGRATTESTETDSPLIPNPVEVGVQTVISGLTLPSAAFDSDSPPVLYLSPPPPSPTPLPSQKFDATVQTSPDLLPVARPIPPPLRPFDLHASFQSPSPLPTQSSSPFPSPPPSNSGAVSASPNPRSRKQIRKASAAGLNPLPVHSVPGLPKSPAQRAASSAGGGRVNTSHSGSEPPILSLTQASPGLALVHGQEKEKEARIEKGKARELSNGGAAPLVNGSSNGNGRGNGPDPIPIPVSLSMGQSYQGAPTFSAPFPFPSLPPPSNMNLNAQPSPRQGRPATGEELEAYWQMMQNAHQANWGGGAAGGERDSFAGDNQPPQGISVPEWSERMVAPDPLGPSTQIEGSAGTNHYSGQEGIPIPPAATNSSHPTMEQQNQPWSPQMLSHLASMPFPLPTIQNPSNMLPSPAQSVLQSTSSGTSSQSRPSSRQSSLNAPLSAQQQHQQHQHQMQQQQNAAYVYAAHVYAQQVAFHQAQQLAQQQALQQQHQMNGSNDQPPLDPNLLSSMPYNSPHLQPPSPRDLNRRSSMPVSSRSMHLYSPSPSSYDPGPSPTSTNFGPLYPYYAPGPPNTFSLPNYQIPLQTPRSSTSSRASKSKHGSGEMRKSPSSSGGRMSPGGAMDLTGWRAKLNRAQMDGDRTAKELEIARWRVTVLEEERITTEIEHQEAMAAVAARAMRAEARIKVLEGRQQDSSSAGSGSPATRPSSAQDNHHVTPLLNPLSTIDGSDLVLADAPLSTPLHPLTWLDLSTLIVSAPAAPFPRSELNFLSSPSGVTTSRNSSRSPVSNDRFRRLNGSRTRRRSLGYTNSEEHGDDEVEVVLDSPVSKRKQPSLSRRQSAGEEIPCESTNEGCGSLEEEELPFNVDDEEDQDEVDRPHVDYIGSLPTFLNGTSTAVTLSPSSRSAPDGEDDRTRVELIEREGGLDQLVSIPPFTLDLTTPTPTSSSSIQSKIAPPLISESSSSATITTKIFDELHSRAQVAPPEPSLLVAAP